MSLQKVDRLGCCDLWLISRRKVTVSEQQQQSLTYLSSLQWDTQLHCALMYGGYGNVPLHPKVLKSNSGGSPVGSAMPRPPENSLKITFGQIDQTERVL